MGTIIYIIGLAISALCLALLAAPFWFFITHHSGIHAGQKLSAKAIATDWELWQKHVNIFGHDTKVLWETSTYEERLALAEQAMRPLDKAHDPFNPRITKIPLADRLMSAPLFTKPNQT